MLYPEESPLARAISNKKVPRFVLRLKAEVIVPPVSPDSSVSPQSTKKEKKKKRFSFGDKSEKEKIAKDKSKKEKKSEKKSNKKLKSDKDKSFVNVEINHNIEEEPQEEDKEKVFASVVSDEEEIINDADPPTLFQTASLATESVITEESPKISALDTSLESAESSVVESAAVEPAAVEPDIINSSLVEPTEVIGNSVIPVTTTDSEIPAESSTLKSIAPEVDTQSLILESSVADDSKVASYLEAANLVVEQPEVVVQEDIVESTPENTVESTPETTVESTPETTVESEVPVLLEEPELSVDTSSSLAIPSTTDEVTEKNEITEQDQTQEIKRSLSFSNSSIFYEQDNQVTVDDDATGYSFSNKKLADKKKRKQKKSVKSEKHNQEKQEKRSKSFSKMLKGNRKKENAGDNSKIELSTNRLTPGILKVFGDHVSKGSNYKAVRVSTISTSQEVVRMALERYGFENSNTKEYVLCDVVGQIREPDTTKGSKKHRKNKRSEKNETSDDDKPKWTTEYVRAVNDNEKPLVLQSLWKPTNGRSRRFELRRRVDVETSCFFINTAVGMGRRASETSLFDDSEHSSVVSGNDDVGRSVSPDFSTMQLSPHSKSKKISGRLADADNNQAPLYAPYLLLLQGFKNSMDKLVHKLDDPTIIVGPYLEDQKQCNVTLFSSDILLPHCWIYKKVKLEEDSSETNLDEINFLVFIEPANGADITVNGASILTTTLLKPGQIVGFGKEYVFLFKDPTQSRDADSTLEWVEDLKNSVIMKNGEPVYATPLKQKKVSEKAIQVESLVDASIMSDRTEDESDEETSSDDEHVHSKTRTNLAPRKHVDKSHLQLSYDIKEEDELLHTIIDIADDDVGGNCYFYWQPLLLASMSTH